MPESTIKWNLPYPIDGEEAAGYSVMEDVEHFELFHATPESGVYCHHPHITFHDGTYYAAWSNHRDGEDGPGQRILFSLSADGRDWSDWEECFPAIGEVREADKCGRVLTSLNWVIVNDIAYEVVEVHDNIGFRTSKDGLSFDRAAAIRAGAPEIRHPGLHKGIGFQYPSVTIEGETLLAIYSIGKEDVAVSYVPLSGLSRTK